jgi:predicted secreted hydrolase
MNSSGVTRFHDRAQQIFHDALYGAGKMLAFCVAGVLLFLLFLAGAFSQDAPQSPYAVAEPGYVYQFPRDHFEHPAYQTEWWYYTGNLVATDGHHFGFELTFFRQANGRAAAPGKTWDARNLYLAHAALSDLDGGKFYHSERLNRQGPGIAGASETEQRVWNGNWQVQWSGEDQELRSITDNFTVQLRLHPEKSPIIHGEHGVSQKSAELGHVSHYISLTRLNTAGEITLQGKPCHVTGVAWMDHEFFTTPVSAMQDGSAQQRPAQEGWDWLSIQLADNTELMLYRFRRKDGTLDPFSSGTFVDAQGQSTHLRAKDFILEPSGATWKSPVTQAIYPIGWKIQIPQLDISLEAKTALPSQELTTPSQLAPSYWEGAITLTGARGSRPLSGVGYLELTGYDRSLQLP